MEINDEVEFILKVRTQYIERRNNEGARKIQSIFKGIMCRVKYLKMRDFVVYHVIRIQTFYRMKLARRNYLRRLAILYFKSSIQIQQYVRGYMVYKKMEVLKRNVSFNIMENAINQIKKKYARHLSIQVWYYFRKYMKNKAVRQAL